MKDDTRKNGQRNLVDLVTPVSREESRDEKLVDLVQPMKVIESGELIDLVTPMKMKKNPKENVKNTGKFLDFSEVCGLKKINVVSVKSKETKKDLEDEEDQRNFSLQLLSRLIEIDDSDDLPQKRIFYVFNIDMNNGESYIAKVSGTELDNLAWIKRESGGAAYLGFGKNEYDDVRKMIRRQVTRAGEITERRFMQNGWKFLDNHWRYVIDTGVIGKNILAVSGDYSRPFQYITKQVGKKNTFKNAINMLDVCEDKKITLPLFLLTHLGILSKLFEMAKFPLKFIVAVIGPTNSRKTSLALCMTKTFARENISTPEITFDSTQGGIEVESAFHADSVLLVDDYRPTMTKRRQYEMEEKLEFLARRYGDRTSKRRMTDFSVNRNSKKYKVSGVCLITGEDITGVQSSITRTIIIDVKKDSVNNDILMSYQNNPFMLNSYLYDFISYITDNFEEIVNFMKKELGIIRKKSNFDIPRYNEYNAQFIMVAKIIGRYASYRGFFDENQCSNWEHSCTVILKELMLANIRGVYSFDMAHVILCVIREEILVNIPTCILQSKDVKNKVASIFEDEEFYYIRAEYLLDIARKYCSKKGINFSFTSTKQLLNFLAQKELIIEKKEGETVRKSHFLPGQKSKIRYVYIRKSSMSKFLDKSEQ